MSVDLQCQNIWIGIIEELELGELDTVGRTRIQRSGAERGQEIEAIVIVGLRIADDELLRLPAGRKSLPRLMIDDGEIHAVVRTAERPAVRIAFGSIVGGRDRISVDGMLRAAIELHLIEGAIRLKRQPF